MKVNLKDTTFLIAVRLDSIQRLENTLVVTSQICRYFDTNICLVEVAEYNNGILKSLLSPKVTYTFIEDKDNVFYRTKYFNQFTSILETPIIALWDTDVVIDKNAIVEAVESIRMNNADIAYPYNGVFWETSEIMRQYYLKTKDIRTLYRNVNKHDHLYKHRMMMGGAVIVNRIKYIDAGMENEKHYGWGNEDFDRFFRFEALNYNIYRVNTPLFHLRHPRGSNSLFRLKIFERLSSDESIRMRNSSKEDIETFFLNKK